MRLLLLAMQWVAVVMHKVVTLDCFTYWNVLLSLTEKGGERTQGHWIRGLQMVADVKLMPHGKKVGPNPHHEAEKLIPAVLLSHLYGLRNSTLYWFAHRDPKTISRWSLGLIKVFLETMKVEFMDVPGPDEPQICFEDAILFSGIVSLVFWISTNFVWNMFLTLVFYGRWIFFGSQNEGPIVFKEFWQCLATEATTKFSPG